MSMDENTILAIALKALKSGGGSGGTTNYNDLNNKPQINGHTLTGDKTGNDLGLLSVGDELTAQQTNTLINLL